METYATTYHADCLRLLRVLGIDGKGVSRVTIDLLPGNMVQVTTESAMTVEILGAFVDELEAQLPEACGGR